MENAENTTHELSELFLQLGLPNDAPSIEEFIRSHYPLPRGMHLSLAPFWTNAQRDLLGQAVSDDADWAIAVDTLDARLREPPPMEIANEAKAGSAARP